MPGLAKIMNFVHTRNKANSMPFKKKATRLSENFFCC